MTEEKKTNWGFRPVLKKGNGEDYLILEEVAYENDIPIARSGMKAIGVSVDEGVEGMVVVLELAIRHIRERGILVDPWPDKK